MERTKKILMISSLSCLAVACLMLILAVFGVPVFEGFLLRLLLVVSTFASAGHFAWLLLGKRAKRTDERPMVPYITGAAVLYMVFFRDLLYNGFSIVL